MIFAFLYMLPALIIAFFIMFGLFVPDKMKQKEESTIEEDNLVLVGEEEESLISEPDQKWDLEIKSRITFMLRIALIWILLMAILDLGTYPQTEMWDTLASNRILGRTYLILTLISLIFCGILLFTDLIIPVMKLIPLKRRTLEEKNDVILYPFTKLTSAFRNSLFSRTLSIFLGVGSAALLIISQILFWGFIVF